MYCINHFHMEYYFLLENVQNCGNCYTCSLSGHFSTAHHHTNSLSITSAQTSQDRKSKLVWITQDVIHGAGRLGRTCVRQFCLTDQRWREQCGKNWVGNIPSAEMSKILPVLFISSKSYSASCSDQFKFVPYIQERLICEIFILRLISGGRGLIWRNALSSRNCGTHRYNPWSRKTRSHSCPTVLPDRSTLTWTMW